MLSATLLTSALAEAVHWAGGGSTVGAGVGVGTAAGCVAMSAQWDVTLCSTMDASLLCLCGKARRDAHTASHCMEPPGAS